MSAYAQEDDDDYRFLGALFKKDFQKKTLKDSLQQKKTIILLPSFLHFIEYFQYLQNAWCNVVIGNVELS